MKQGPLVYYSSIAPVFTTNIDDMDISEQGGQADLQVELIHIDAIAEAYRAAQNRSSVAERLEWKKIVGEKSGKASPTQH